MGMDLVVTKTACSIADLLVRLAAAGLPATVLMVDNQLHAPNAAVSDGWRDVRIKTAAGTLSLKRRPDGIAVIVFGNADVALQAAQRTVADALTASGGG